MRVRLFGKLPSRRGLLREAVLRACPRHQPGGRRCMEISIVLEAPIPKRSFGDETSPYVMNQSSDKQQLLHKIGWPVTHMHTYMRACRPAYSHIDIHTCMRAYIHAMNMHTYIHTYIHYVHTLRTPNPQSKIRVFSDPTLGSRSRPVSKETSWLVAAALSRKRRSG